MKARNQFWQGSIQVILHKCNIEVLKWNNFHTTIFRVLKMRKRSITSLLASVIFINEKVILLNCIWYERCHLILTFCFIWLCSLCLISIKLVPSSTASPEMTDCCFHGFMATRNQTRILSSTVRIFFHKLELFHKMLTLCVSFGCVGYVWYRLSWLCSQKKKAKG